MQRTFKFFLSVVRWSLNMRMISARVALRPGILTPFVAREAMSIISLNFGCSNARSGYTLTKLELMSQN
jgi:hypothetical protein